MRCDRASLNRGARGKGAGPWIRQALPVRGEFLASRNAENPPRGGATVTPMGLLSSAILLNHPFADEGCEPISSLGAARTVRHRPPQTLSTTEQLGPPLKCEGILHNLYMVLRFY
jgi:hypothetical protein